MKLKEGLGNFFSATANSLVMKTSEHMNPHRNGNKIKKFRSAIAVKIIAYFPSNIKIRAPDIPGKIIAVADSSPELKMVKKLFSIVCWPKSNKHRPKLKPANTKDKSLNDHIKLFLMIDSIV